MATGDLELAAEDLVITLHGSPCRLLWISLSFRIFSSTEGVWKLLSAPPLTRGDWAPIALHNVARQTSWMVFIFVRIVKHFTGRCTDNCKCTQTNSTCHLFFKHAGVSKLTRFLSKLIVVVNWNQINLHGSGCGNWVSGCYLYWSHSVTIISRLCKLRTTRKFSASYI